MNPIVETVLTEVDGWGVGYVRFGRTMEALSSAILNGGDVLSDAFMVMQVEKNYCGDDPAMDAARVRDALGLPENTVCMMTAAEVGTVFNTAEGSHGGISVAAVATAGLSNHVVAGDVLDNYPERRVVSDMRAARIAGTINIAVVSPLPLTMEGKVNMMIPLVEAKSAAMADRGYRETGTTSDSMAVFSPIGDDRIGYTGTGSDIGIAAARAVRSAVGTALERRCEHPVMEEPFRLLAIRGYGLGRLSEMSGLPEDGIRAAISRVLDDKGIRGALDMAMFCCDRADSMADDGDPSFKDAVLRALGPDGIDANDSTMECAVRALLRDAGV